VRAGVERVVAAGGDGTVREVVSGILAAGLGDRTQLGLLPLGTGGDLARTAGAPRDLMAAARRIAHGSALPVDAGRVGYRDAADREVVTGFLNVASLGVSGLVTELVEQASKALGGRVAFLLGTLRALRRYRPVPVQLLLDGELLHDGPLVLAAAANGRYFGGGMQIAPEARLDDGLLDVVVVPEFSRLRLLRELPRIYRGTHLGVEGVIHAKGRRLEARAASGAARIEIDGEPLGSAPAEVELLPGALRLCGLGEGGPP
jgi:YegS/Rv2252/BmrU family lipid kinase